MNTYLILQNPGHNRVYFNASEKLALAELEISAPLLSSSIVNLEAMYLAKVRYISFQTKNPLKAADLVVLSRLSFVYALFEKQNEALVPMELRDQNYLHPKIGSLLKYPGKTNEIFTKLMIHIALCSSKFHNNPNLNLLDPVSGKGTTLFEGTVYGMNVTGVEIDPKSAEFTTQFFKKYLQTEKIKHNQIKRQVYGATKSKGTFMTSFQYGLTKEDFKLHPKQLNIVLGSTTALGNYFKANSFHLIVGDLPYGVAHGNNMQKKHAGITRNPTELVESALLGWYKVLQPGGAIVLAWNSFLVSRKTISKAFEKVGFKVKNTPVFDQFEHMVDHSIKRDIIVAVK